MAHSSELECPQHGNMGVWATMHSVVESFFQLFIHDHSALQLTLSCDGIKNRVHHMSGIPQCYNTADTLNPTTPTKRVAGLGRERERERERSLWHHFYPIRAQSESSRPDQQRLLCGTVHWPASAIRPNTPKPDNQPCLLKTNGKPCFLFNLLSTTFCIQPWERTVDNGPFSQDCDDAFNSHQHHKSSIVFHRCNKKKKVHYNTILCIGLPLHQIKIKLVNANARVFSNAGSMGGMVHVKSFSLTLYQSFSVFLFI